MSTQNCFQVLGVPYPGCTIKDVRKAYRRHALETHPDRFQTNVDKEQAAIAFRHLHSVYEQCVDFLESSSSSSVDDDDTPPFADASPPAPRRETTTNKNNKDSSSPSSPAGKHKKKRPAPSLSELKRMFQDMCDEMDQDFDKKQRLEECKTVTALIAAWPNTEKCWALVKNRTPWTNSDTADRLKKNGHVDLSLFLVAKIKEQSNQLHARMHCKNQAHAVFIESNWDFKNEEKLRSYTNSWMLFSFEDIIIHVKDSRIHRVLRQWREDQMRDIRAVRVSTIAGVARTIEEVYPNATLMKDQLEKVMIWERKEVLALLRDEVRAALLVHTPIQPVTKTPVTKEGYCSIMPVTKTPVAKEGYCSIM